MNDTVSEYGRVLRERWRWIVWGVLLTLAATTLFLLLRPPLYRSEAAVFVRTPGDVSRVLDGGDSYAQGRARTYAALANSRDVAARVIADLGLGLTPEVLSARVEAVNPPGTALIEFEFRAPSAEESEQMATVFLSELAATVRTLESVPGSLVPRAELIVVDTPGPTARVVAMRATIPVVLSGAVLIGALLGSAGAVLRFLFDHSIRDPRDAARISGRPVLGSIGGEPTEQFTVEERGILYRLLAAVDRSERGAFTVTGAGPGSTVSAVSVFLATALAMRSDSVVLVDLDFRSAELTEALSDRHASGVADVLRGETTPAEAAREVSLRTTHSSFIGVGTAAGAIDDRMFTAPLRQMVYALRTSYTWVVLTCPSLPAAVEIGAESDVVVLAVGKNVTTEEQLRQASALLPRDAVVVFDMDTHWSPGRSSERDRKTEAAE